MASDTAKIRLKVGELEVEYEGDASFLKEDIFNLMSKMTSFWTEHNDALSVVPPSGNTNNTSSTSSDPAIDVSMTTMASRLDVKSGPDLVMASATYLTLCKSREKFPREDILHEMKAAPNYYKESMSGNLTKSLQNLIKNDRLIQSTAGTYALTADEKKAMEKLFAESA